MRSSSGHVRVFTDIDIPYGTTPVMLVESLIRTRGFHMVIGDRTFPQSRYETRIPFGRRMASGVFSKITATLVTGGFFDTQCGLKGFRGDIAEALFGLQTVERFAFDVELIYLAFTYGLEIKRIPVMLESNTTSSVRPAVMRFRLWWTLHESRSISFGETTSRLRSGGLLRANAPRLRLLCVRR